MHKQDNRISEELIRKIAMQYDIPEEEIERSFNAILEIWNSVYDTITEITEDLRDMLEDAQRAIDNLNRENRFLKEQRMIKQLPVKIEPTKFPSMARIHNMPKARSDL